MERRATRGGVVEWNAGLKLDAYICSGRVTLDLVEQEAGYGQDYAYGADGDTAEPEETLFG